MRTPERHRIIRARQRSRTTLRGFSEDLQPAVDEVGIDRVQITVSGSWRVTAPDLSAAEYRELLTTANPEMDWFKTPRRRDRSPQSVIIETFKEPRIAPRRSPRERRSTISQIKITVRGWEQSGGDLRCEFTCNPTRTLAHLLAAYPADSGLVDGLASLDPAQFFALSPNVPPSLDDNDNWIADVDAARDAFGPDVFTRFLPIFVRQLQLLCVKLLAPTYDGMAIEVDGAADVASATGCTLRLEWGEAKVPQIETYFERYHSQARSVIRSAAQTVLTAFDDATVRHHLNQQGFERSGDLFSVSCELPNARRLVMYAKAQDRLRFEVRRLGSGRYPETLLPGPLGRLLTIMSAERANLVDACQWRQIGNLFAEHAAPAIGDLLSLVSAISEACDAAGADAQPVLDALLVDGGLQRSPINERLVHALQTRGVLERISPRHRNGPLPHRHTLTADYRAVFEAVLSAMCTRT